MHSPGGQITRNDDTFLSHKCKSFPKMHHRKVGKGNKISVLLITSHIFTKHFSAIYWTPVLPLPLKLPGLYK